LALLIAVCLALPGEAQYYGGRPYYGGGGGYGYGGGYGASTAAGSAMYGMADVVRASGEANLSNSEAAKNWQDARSMEYDNRIKGTQTYFEMRKMNRAYTDAERSKPMTSEEAFRAAREAAPKRLSASQLDPVTGGIAWPVLLTAEDFAADRKVVDALFTDRERAGSVTGDQYQKIQQVTDDMLAKLKKNISNYSPNDYIKSKKFLESLAYESRFAAA
jgi:hypothetical protein